MILINRVRKLRRKIRWHVIDMMARLGIGNAEIFRQGRRPAYGRAKPKLLTVPQGDDGFDPYDALHGAYSSLEQCRSIPYAVWADVAECAECIRYYPAGLVAGENRRVLLFFSGDIVLRTARGVRLVGKTYSKQTPNRLTKLMEEWANDAGIPAIFLARPGIFGSSGDHDKRRLPYEIDLMSRALDLLKQQHGIEQFILVGQSGGAQVAAALLNRRQDIEAAVMTSGLLSVHRATRYWRKFSPVPGGAAYPVEALYDPLQEVAGIRREPEPKIILISDPRDRVVLLRWQSHYLQALQEAGFKPAHIYAHAVDPKHHSLSLHGRKAAALLVQGKSVQDIRKALVDLDVANIEITERTLSSVAEN